MKLRTITVLSLLLGMAIEVKASFLLEEEIPTKSFSQNDIDIHQITSGNLEEILDFIGGRKNQLRKIIEEKHVVPDLSCQTSKKREAAAVALSYVPPVSDPQVFDVLKGYMFHVIFVKRESDLYPESSLERKYKMDTGASCLYGKVTVTDNLVISRVHTPYKVIISAGDMLSVYQEQLRQRNVSFMIDLWHLAEGKYDQVTADAVPTLKKANRLLREQRVTSSMKHEVADIFGEEKIEQENHNGMLDLASQDTGFLACLKVVTQAYVAFERRFLACLKVVTQAYVAFERQSTNPHHRQLVMATKRLDVWLDKMGENQ